MSTIIVDEAAAIGEKLDEAAAQTQPLDPCSHRPLVCCGKLDEFVAAGFAFPFVRPLLYNLERGEMYTPGWVVYLYRRGGKGAPVLKDSQRVILNYCPFCGAKLEWNNRG